jgi:hypothetical protein
LGASYLDLRTARLLPATLAVTELETAHATLKRWLDGPLPAAEARLSYDAARVFRGQLDDLGPKLGVGLQIVHELKLAAQARNAPAQSYEALGRYPILGEPSQGQAWSFATWLADFPSFSPLLVDKPLKGDATIIQDFQSVLGPSRLASANAPPPADATSALWRTWQDRLTRFVGAAPPALTDFGFDDLLSATLNAGPGALFSANLTAMTLLDWSRACVAALGAAQGASPPRWVLVAILRVLRFDAAALEAVAQDAGGPLGRPSADDPELARPFIDGAERERPGVLVVVDNVADLDPNAPIPDRGPALLYLPRSLAEETRVGSGLDWLARIGVLKAKADDGKLA